MDLGCGMGLAGVAAGRMGMHVLFADLETPALVFARLNSLSDRDHVRFRKVNWQTDRLKERFDLILGADIVYDRSQWTFLDTFFQAHLSAGGAVLIGEPGRSSGEEFEPWITARGWKLTRFSQRISGKDYPIRLMQLTRK
jgi:predicted nicotinamide N-methyase